MALNLKKVTQFATDAAIMSKGFDDRQLMLLLTAMAYRFADDLEFMADDLNSTLFEDFYEDTFLSKLSFLTLLLSDDKKFACISKHEMSEYMFAYDEFSQKFGKCVFKFSMSTAVHCVMPALIIASGTPIRHDKESMFELYKEFSIDLKKHVTQLDADGASWANFEPKLQKDIDAVMNVIRYISLKCPKQTNPLEPLDADFVKTVINMAVKGRDEFHLEIPPCEIELEFVKDE